MSTARSNSLERPHRASKGKRNKTLRHAVFLLPAVIYLGALSIYPLVNLLIMSVSKVDAGNIVKGSWPFVGLGNIVQLLHQSDFQQSFPITVVYVLVVVGVGMIGGLAAAVILEQRSRLGGAVQALMIFTWAMPPVVLGSLWKFLLLPHGLMNVIGTGLGIYQQPLYWLVRRTLALMSVALVNSWYIVPFTALVYRAALIDIPPDLIDAARVDGANVLQQFLYVKLPLLTPVTLILTILTVVYGFRSFDFIYVMTYGGPGTATTTLPFLSYRLSFINYNFGLGSMVAILTILIVAGLAYAYVRITRRTEER